MSGDLDLYSATRASAPYRVRIALQLKGVKHAIHPVDLVAAEHQGPDYAARNPQKLVPTLEAGGATMTQSLAILEWLEETYPEPPLLPVAAADRAVVRAMADIVACDIHPVNNLRILKRLEAEGLGDDRRLAWTQQWINDGFSVLEGMIQRHGAGWSFGEQPGYADCCLVPQIFNSQRFKVDLSPYPAISAIWKRAGEHPAFEAAAPHNQPGWSA